MIISLYYLFMHKPVVELPENCKLVIDANAGLVTCERDWRWAPAPLQDFDLWIVVGGEGRIILNGTVFILHAGCAFVFEPGDHVRGEHDPANRLRVLFCHFQIRDSRGNTLHRIPDYWPENAVIVHDLSCVEMLGRLLLQGIASQGTNRAAELALRQLLLQRIQDAHNDPPEPLDARVSRVLAAIQAAPEKTWTLSCMAQVAHLSVSQFRRLFYTATGVTPNVYLARERVSRARKLLIESNLTLEAIADTLGYNDVYYFSRQFKSHAGSPPAAYRRAGRHAIFTE